MTAHRAALIATSPMEVDPPRQEPGPHVGPGVPTRPRPPRTPPGDQLSDGPRFIPRRATYAAAWARRWRFSLERMELT